MKEALIESMKSTLYLEWLCGFGRWKVTGVEKENNEGVNLVTD